MSKAPKFAISPIRQEDFPQWYQEVIKAADLAEHSPVRGCMVIKPWGYAIWENLQKILDDKFKQMGHENAYFPLFIPLSFFEKEAKHVEGFAKECAVVTHHRLEEKKGKLVPASPLEEPLIIRPTSEMIIAEAFSRWISSYRDLPIKINQWANVVRWEMRTRTFLRTTEILWQEGHTAHSSKQEAYKHARLMLDVYANVCEKALAIPVIKGEKSESEKFPGAVDTFTIEAMMQDRKALQCGTSHFLGQNFSKAGNITFENQNSEKEYAWTTSWGITTRLLGAMIMVHSDDDGAVLPPKVAGSQIVILPILHKEESKKQVLSYCEQLKEDLSTIDYFGKPLKVVIDQRDMRGGEKTWNWIKKGIPIRIEIGPKEVEENNICMCMRIKSHKDKQMLSKEDLLENIGSYLDNIHTTLFKRAKAHLKEHTFEPSTKEDFYELFQSGKGGFASVYWAGDMKLEETLKQDLSVTIRCLPFDAQEKEGICLFTQTKTKQKVIFAKAY